jgi:hypothetical protein
MKTAPAAPRHDSIGARRCLPAPCRTCSACRSPSPERQAVEAPERGSRGRRSNRLGIEGELDLSETNIGEGDNFPWSKGRAGGDGLIAPRDGDENRRSSSESRGDAAGDSQSRERGGGIMFRVRFGRVWGAEPNWAGPV